MEYFKLTKNTLEELSITEKTGYRYWQNALIHRFIPLQPRLVIICGAPGSGKTTLAQSILDIIGYDYYEADQYFTRRGKYKFIRHKLEQAHMYCYSRAKADIAYSVGCTVSNTSTRLQDIQEYANLAAKYYMPCICIVLHNEYTSEHNVPADVVQRHREQMKCTVEQLKEGHVELHTLIEVDLT